MYCSDVGAGPALRGIHWSNVDDNGNDNNDNNMCVFIVFFFYCSFISFLFLCIKNICVYIYI